MKHATAEQARGVATKGDLAILKADLCRVLWISQGGGLICRHGDVGCRCPTQKPLAILERIVRVHSNPGDTVLDFFGGSGTAGEAALRNGRQFVMVDENPEAVCVMRKRLSITGGARDSETAVPPAAKFNRTSDDRHHSHHHAVR